MDKPSGSSTQYLPGDENVKVGLGSASTPMSTVVIDMMEDENVPESENQHTSIICVDTDLSERELLMLPDKVKLTHILPFFPPFKCPFNQCRKMFEDRNRLQKHYRNHQERKHGCQFCAQKFLYMKDKIIHERTHTGERPYECHLCSRKFVQKCTLVNHLKTHDKAAEKETCDICGRSYSYKKSLAHHKKIKHSSFMSGEQFHTCAKCGKKYIGLHQYNIHIAKCKGRKAPVYKCRTCGASFDSKSSFQQHKEESCRVQIFQCGVCNVVMNTEKNVRSHMAEAHQVGFNNCVKVRVFDGEKTNTSQSSCSVVDVVERPEIAQEHGLKSSDATEAHSNDLCATRARLTVYPKSHSIVLENG